MQTRCSIPLLVVALGASALVGCGSDSEPAESPEPATPFELRFAALDDGAVVGCTDEVRGLGPDGADTVAMNDLRFYVSNLRFADSSGKPVEVQLDRDEFQYASSDGAVALVDLAGNAEGSCSPDSIAYAEGTARTHLALTGKTRVHSVASVSFDVGVPQQLMKATIATNTPEGAPSPLDELYWNWNTGYRHFVLNLTVGTAAGDRGEGYIHLGSRDCAPEGDGIKALEDRDSCTYVNTPAVKVDAFDLERDTIGVDLRAILAGLDFVSPIYDSATFEVIGEGPGVECHSSPMQPDCPVVFGGFGLDIATGTADASNDAIFVKAP